jgi:hypothetical protein
MNPLSSLKFHFFIAERGGSVEEDRSPGGQTLIHVSPQPIHLSPSRQSSSSTELVNHFFWIA